MPPIRGVQRHATHVMVPLHAERWPPMPSIPPTLWCHRGVRVGTTTESKKWAAVLAAARIGLFQEFGQFLHRGGGLLHHTELTSITFAFGLHSFHDAGEAPYDGVERSCWPMGQ